MSKIVRFGVSLEKKLLDGFDKLISDSRYSNRSEAIRDLIRARLVDEQWTRGREVVGTINIVYNPHKRDLSGLLTRIQHKFHHLIIASQHIHMDHDNCLEIVAVKGKPKEVRQLAEGLKGVKGVKHSSLAMSTSGKGLV